VRRKKTRCLWGGDQEKAGERDILEEDIRGPGMETAPQNYQKAKKGGRVRRRGVQNNAKSRNLKNGGGLSKIARRKGNLVTLKSESKNCRDE